MAAKINSRTKLYALIGDPVEHSLSPLMQNLAFQALGLNSVYLALRVGHERLQQAVEGMRALDIQGLNVTIPHKVAIMGYLDGVDTHARDIGAVNTVANREGSLIGYNTDGAAALAVLREERSDPSGKKVVLLGSGGAARALSFYVAPLAKSLLIINRTESAATELASSLSERFKANTIVGMKLTDDVLRRELRDTDVVINATSIGMHPKVDETIVDGKLLHKNMTVFDIVYNPIETRLLREASASGAKVINGAKMLVYQGALAFEIWTGRKAQVDLMLKAVTDVIKGM
jgi:shikimate dehydrogenase